VNEIHFVRRRGNGSNTAFSADVGCGFKSKIGPIATDMVLAKTNEKAIT